MNIRFPHITLDIFEKWAQEEWDSLPEIFKNQVENLAIFVQDEPDEELLRRMKIRNKYQLLGLYSGVPLKYRGSYYMNVMPDSITLFMNPILQQCRSIDDIRHQVRKTLIHEIAHHFGFSESQIRDAME